MLLLDEGVANRSASDTWSPPTPRTQPCQHRSLHRSAARAELRFQLRQKWFGFLRSCPLTLSCRSVSSTHQAESHVSTLILLTHRNVICWQFQLRTMFFLQQQGVHGLSRTLPVTVSAANFDLFYVEEYNEASELVFPVWFSPASCLGADISGRGQRR